MNQIEENIRALRKRLGLTQVEFAKQVDVSQGTLGDVEQENCKPSVETVLSIHERYWVTLHWIRKGIEEVYLGEIELGASTLKRDELIEVIKVLPEKALLEVLDYIKYKLKVKD